MKHIRISVCMAMAVTGFFVHAAPPPEQTPESPQQRLSLPAPQLEQHSFWNFANGALLAIDAVNGISFIPKSSINFKPAEMNMLVSGKVNLSPRHAEGPRNLMNNFYVFHMPSHIAYVEVAGKPYIVTEKGEAILLPFDTEALIDASAPIPVRLSAIETSDRSGNTTTYYIISMRYAPANDENLAKQMKERSEVAGSLNYGETFIVRQDGAYQRLDYRAHDQTFGNEFAFSEDGFLTSKGSPFHRSFDIHKWDLERRFVAKPIDPIVSPDGAAIDPANLINKFSKSMNHLILADQNDRGLKYQPLSSEDRNTFRRALAKVEMNSLAVLGPAGSGKTEMVKSFVAEVAAGKIPDIPRSTQFLSIEASSLGAGTKWIGAMEARIQALITYSEMVPLVLVIDEIHSLVGQGTHSQNSNDIFEMLKPYMATGQIRIIGMSTKEEFDRAFSNNRALYQRFNQFHMPAPTRDEVLAKYEGWTKKHKLTAPKTEVLQRAYDLSEEFNAIGAQPRKGILLLVEAYADLKINNRDSAPTVADIETAARRIYNLQVSHFSRSASRDRLAKLPAALDARIVGQPQAKKLLVDNATINLAGVHAHNRPRMVNMFVGPKGTGKTDLGYAYADAMGLPVKRVQLSQFTQHDGPTALLREIKQALEINALTLFILDEADKCPKNVIDVLLPILDGGRFVLPAHMNNGKWVDAAEVSALNAQFLINGNFAADFTKQGKDFGFVPSRIGHKVDPTDEALRQAIAAEGFSEFVLDRVDGIAHVDYLVKDDFRGVLKMHIAGILKDIVHHKKIQVSPEDSENLIDSLTNEYYGEALSNRTALRLLNAELRLKIAQALLKNEKQPSGLTLRYNEETKSVDACETILGGEKGA